MKHLKKDDGYVLVYVLIVFTVLALVAGSICTMALNNLKAQKAEVVRMEARYEAEGYLQPFIANVERLELSEKVGTTNIAEEHFWDAVASLENSALIVDEDADNNSLTLVADTVNHAEMMVHATYTGDGKTARIDAALKVSVTVTEHPIPDDPDTSEVESGSEYTYQVSGPVQYMPYEISYQTAANGEEGDAG